MKRLIAVTTLFLAATNVYAKDIDNSKMLALYKKQLEQTKQIAYETQQVLQASETVVELAKKISTISAGLEIKAINHHFKFLDEDSTKLYGDYTVITHFEACRRLPLSASFVWQAHINNIGRDNSKIINKYTEDYNSTLAACAEEIKTPPPLKTEDPGQLQIIDVE